MRKKSNYKRRPRLINPMQWVIDGFTTMKNNPKATEIKIRNHQAMFEMTQGNANITDFCVIDTALLMAGAMASMNPKKLGGHLIKEIDEAILSSLAVAERARTKNIFRFSGPEMQAINLGMEIHDMQLDTCTQDELFRATILVKPVIIARDKVINGDKHGT